MRRCVKTAEFWLAIAWMVAGFSFGVFAIYKGTDLMGAAAFLGAISGPVITLIFGRSRIKEKHGDT